MSILRKHINFNQEEEKMAFNNGFKNLVLKLLLDLKQFDAREKEIRHDQDEIDCQKIDTWQCCPAHENLRESYQILHQRGRGIENELIRRGRLRRKRVWCLGRYFEDLFLTNERYGFGRFSPKWERTVTKIVDIDVRL